MKAAIKNIDDLINAGSFTIGSSNIKYKLKKINDFGEVTLNRWLDTESCWYCGGYAYPNRKGSIKVKIQNSGLHFESIIKFKDINPVPNTTAPRKPE